MTAIDRYFDQLQATLARVHETQGEAMEKAACAIADSLKGGGTLYTFGTGHGHLLALEIFYRAGGPARVCPILDEALMLHVSAAGSTLVERREDVADQPLAKYPVGKGDVIVISSNSGRNAAPVMLARRCRERGAFVIALTSMAHSSSVSSRNSLGLRLFETADLVLDNCGIPGDASVAFPDGTHVGATSTAVGAAMLQSICARVKEIALAEGIAAEFFVSSNIDGGDEINNRLVDKYKDVIPGLL